MNKNALLEEIGETLFDFSLAINQEFGGKHQDIPENHRLVLLVLHRYQHLYVKDLASLLHLSPSSVSQLLSKMEKEDYIKRELDPEQRRQTFVKLSTGGDTALQGMEETRNEIFSKYLMKLSETDLETFRDLAIKLKSVVETEWEVNI